MSLIVGQEWIPQDIVLLSKVGSKGVDVFQTNKYLLPLLGRSMFKKYGTD
jgi:hypothetical protein